MRNSVFCVAIFEGWKPRNSQHGQHILALIVDSMVNVGNIADYQFSFRLEILD